MKTTPRPLRIAAHGRITGSAYGARRRTPTCAPRKITDSAAGKYDDAAVMFCCTAASMAIESDHTIAIAMTSRPSSVLRRVGGRLAGGGDAATTTGVRAVV